MNIEDLAKEERSPGSEETHADSAPMMAPPPIPGEEAPTATTPKATRTSLVMLVILAIGGGGLYFMYGKAGPASAHGAVDPGADVRRRVDTFLEGGTSQLKTLEAALRDTKKVVDQFRDYPAMNQIPLAALRTNPFQAHPAVAAEVPDAQAEARKRHEAERAAALTAVAALHLQSVLCADSRKACTIDGTVCHEGQVVEGFTVEKIEPKGVIVRKGSFRFEIGITQ